MWQNQNLQWLVMNSRYLWPFGEKFIIVMVNVSLNLTNISTCIDQLNFSRFCAKCALGISWQLLNHRNVFVQSGYRFHMYFHIPLILHELSISLPHEDGFSNVENAYMKSVYCSMCDDYAFDVDETWMCRGLFYTTDHVIFGHEVKAK